MSACLPENWSSSCSNTNSSRTNWAICSQELCLQSRATADFFCSLQKNGGGVCPTRIKLNALGFACNHGGAFVKLSRSGNTNHRCKLKRSETEVSVQASHMHHVGSHAKLLPLLCCSATHVLSSAWQTGLRVSVSCFWVALTCRRLIKRHLCEGRPLCNNGTTLLASGSKPRDIEACMVAVVSTKASLTLAGQAIRVFLLTIADTRVRRSDRALACFTHKWRTPGKNCKKLWWSADVMSITVTRRCDRRPKFNNRVWRAIRLLLLTTR